MMQGDLVTINNMHYSLHIFKDDLRAILERAKNEISKIRLIDFINQKPINKDDLETARKILPYIAHDTARGMLYSIYLWQQKHGKNNENKKDAESNKQMDGDVE